MSCIRPELGARPLAAVTPLEIQAVYARLGERGLSPRTVRYVHAVLRSALEQAVKRRLCAEPGAARGAPPPAR